MRDCGGLRPDRQGLHIFIYKVWRFTRKFPTLGQHDHSRQHETTHAAYATPHLPAEGGHTHHTTVQVTPRLAFQRTRRMGNRADAHAIHLLRMWPHAGIVLGGRGMGMLLLRAVQRRTLVQIALPHTLRSPDTHLSGRARGHRRSVRGAAPRRTALGAAVHCAHRRLDARRMDAS